jgi:hypothetical protein
MIHFGKVSLAQATSWNSCSACRLEDLVASWRYLLGSSSRPKPAWPETAATNSFGEVGDCFMPLPYFLIINLIKLLFNLMV